MTDPNNPYQGQTPYGNPPTPQTPYSTQSHAGHGNVSHPYASQGHAAHAPVQPQPQAKGGSGAKTFFLAFAGALLACVLAFGASSLIGGSGSGGGSTVTLGSQSASTIDVENEDPTLAEAVAAKCLPSVAAIDVYAESSSQGYGMYGMYGYGYGNGNSESELVEASLGSGVVLSQDGYIITNYHVIEGGSAFKVTIAGETYDAELVGSDPSSDIAVIKAQNASGLTPIEVGDSDSLIIGEWVMSIGSPFGLEQSVATGIVSATSRSQVLDSSESGMGGGTTIYPNMIQTDAAINPGNSGGALVDADGKLIGINTLITSYSGNYSGVGFAIPVNYAVNLAEQIIEGKTPTHAQLGVSLTTVNSQIAKRYGLSADAGAYVTGVYANTGAAAAGLQQGDIITAFDGAAVESASDLMLDVRLKNPGDEITLTVNRGGEVLELKVTLGSDSEQASVSQGSWLDSLRN
ncbi:MAG: trypsin-like peptidase domain-containing protein [Eggerthellaceae bacterium]|nr:trypsin-like peptidase domain-containing protein [Eggerthellaceae bacterium]